ncbi:LysM domain-containing protein [Trinickia caryophylli]|uniref:LysM domain-containing protein n=1 Tax=Trinickia caryophylli TaxID=28094 RepID=A0A1X7E137_TRICW|nr:LysM domain-containing protein [Trinickia caryophylli]PMS14067.1 LysM domain-containing protein [Trinickia caryophylli]TRX17763.1 LysM peptidoglycan-binding domain-containing protein [Trinickia caryophylli]WQE11473.1 LysM domain-containing protein [Trinickia caryophylli]SMF25315.1 LysM domain-containing protein [Trinickia caryophylli]GLU32638.1 hypothetical protein Busp01_24800 [Trinickia caryophylli]
MAAQPEQTGFEKWKATLDKAVGDPKWNEHDCDIRAAVTEFNSHLSGTAGYVALDWRLIKAMAWTETGAARDEWNTKPMQIGVPGDPGLTSLLTGNEGGDLILPPAWKARLTVASVKSLPGHNIRAAIGYLLMRMANFDYKTVPAADTKVYEVKVKPGDSFDRIAKAQGTTVDMLKKANPKAAVLKPGEVLQFQKASTARVITSWRAISTASIAQRYNGGGDPNYAKKLEYALNLVRQVKETACAQ